MRRAYRELGMLGFEVSDRSVSRCLPRRRPPSGAIGCWLTFLRNHRGAIAAMDFFTVPTATFRVLHVWFAIAHARRRVLHFDVTEHPLAAWVVQQLREAFPTPPRRTTSFSTATTITTNEPILHLPRRLPLGAAPWRQAKHTLPSWPYLDLAGCIIATTLRRESPHRLATKLVQLREPDE